VSACLAPSGSAPFCFESLEFLVYGYFLSPEGAANQLHHKQSDITEAAQLFQAKFSSELPRSPF